MKICIVADGNEDHTRLIVNYFAQRNHEVHLISLGFRKGYDSRVNLHYLHPPFLRIAKISNLLFFIFAPFQTRKLVAKIQPDILDGHYVISYGFFASFSQFHPLVVTAWGSDALVQARLSVFWRFFARYAVNRSDYMICLFNKDILQSEIGKWIPSNLSIASIPRGIDIELFARKSKDIRLRQKLNIQPDCPVIINIRGAEPIYDPGTFIRSIPLVVKECPEAIFLIVYQKRYQETYQKQIIELGVKKNVIILDWMANEEIAAYLGLANIYVSTSLSDGASNALFEGMASELAPVVTDIPANRYWIENEKNGFLFKAGDYTSLAKYVISLIRDKEKQLDFGKKCHKLVLEKAEFKIQMAKIEKIYSELVLNQSKKQI
jgi:L-malate glycosyltransferase